MDIIDQKKRVEIFCCYARNDQSLMQDLKKHLKLWERQSLIAIWADTDITPGTNWEKEIARHLKAAHIILLLVSPDFLASDYCYSREMKYAMERYDHGEVCVLPIILRHCAWQESPFGKIQALPANAKPVVGSGWHNPDEAFTDVAIGIRRVVEELTQTSQQNDSKDFLSGIGSEVPKAGGHSPNQSKGDVADVPFFPNLGKRDSTRASDVSRPAPPLPSSPRASYPFDTPPLPALSRSGIYTPPRYTRPRHGSQARPRRRLALPLTRTLDTRKSWLWTLGYTALLLLLNLLLIYFIVTYPGIDTHPRTSTAPIWAKIMMGVLFFLLYIMSSTLCGALLGKWPGALTSLVVVGQFFLLMYLVDPHAYSSSNSSPVVFYLDSIMFPLTALVTGWIYEHRSYASFGQSLLSMLIGNALLIVTILIFDFALVPVWSNSSSPLALTIIVGVLIVIFVVGLVALICTLLEALVHKIVTSLASSLNPS